MFNAADDALVADLVRPDRREAGYASVRVANNLGVSSARRSAALLLLGNAWIAARPRCVRARVASLARRVRCGSCRAAVARAGGAAGAQLVRRRPP